MSDYELSFECRTPSKPCGAVAGARGTALRGIAGPVRNDVPQLFYVGVYRAPSPRAARQGLEDFRRSQPTGRFDEPPAGGNLGERGRNTLRFVTIREWSGLISGGTTRYLSANGEAAPPQRRVGGFLVRDNLFISFSATRWLDTPGDSADRIADTIVARAIERLNTP